MTKLLLPSGNVFGGKIKENGSKCSKVARTLCKRLVIGSIPIVSISVSAEIPQSLDFGGNPDSLRFGISV